MSTAACVVATKTGHARKLEDGEGLMEDGRAGDDGHAKTQPLQHSPAVAHHLLAQHLADRMAQRLDHLQRTLRADDIGQHTNGVQRVVSAERRGGIQDERSHQANSVTQDTVGLYITGEGRVAAGTMPGLSSTRPRYALGGTLEMLFELVDDTAPHPFDREPLPGLGAAGKNHRVAVPGMHQPRHGRRCSRVSAARTLGTTSKSTCDRRRRGKLAMPGSNT